MQTEKNDVNTQQQVRVLSCVTFDVCFVCAGDIVAVELLPEAEWRQPSSKLPGQGKAAGGGKGGGEGGEEEEEDGGERGDDDKEDTGTEAAPELFQVRLCSVCGWVRVCV